MAQDHRSIIPNIPGVPWWAAVVVAVTGTAAGFAFDAGSGKELTSVFAALYVAGCVAAVLGVRQSGIFTAVIQPPLILFCAVPGAYWLFHGAKFTGLKDLLINCGYPLIERFPLMVFTTGGVLVIGIIRWLLDMVVRPVARADVDTASNDAEPAGPVGRLTPLFARMLPFLRRESADDDTADKAATPGSQRAHAVRRSAKPARSAGSADARRTAKRPATSRSRHIRPPLEEAADPTVDRARRPRRTTRTREFDSPEPPRSSRVPRDPDLRGRPSRETRRDPRSRQAQPARRSSRFDPYEPVEPYEPYEPLEPRRRSVPNGTSGATATHHPISQVRYRDSTRADESRGEPPSRPRRLREPGADSWEYDV